MQTLIPAIKERASIPAIRPRREMRRRICLHEASHAVVSNLIGLDCFGVTAVPGFGQNQRATELAFDAPQAAKDWAELVVKAAGPEAEVHFMGKSIGHHTDARDIEFIVDRFAQDDDRDLIKSATRKCAAGMVRDHADKIEPVAAALMERGRLTDADVRELMGSHTYE